MLVIRIRDGSFYFLIRQVKDKLEDMDISLNNIWFLGVRLVANTSNLNISKDIWKIVLLLSYYKNLGYWWPFAVGFMSLCLLVFKLEHFKKSHQKFFFHHLGFIAIFWKTSKTTQLWTSAITKPLDLQCIMRYLWKDNIQIIHLVPKEVMYVQRFGCKQVLKIMATSRTPSFLSDTSISSSLSLALQMKVLPFPVKIYSFEIFTRASADSSLVIDKNRLVWPIQQ